MGGGRSSSGPSPQEAVAQQAAQQVGSMTAENGCVEAESPVY